MKDTEKEHHYERERTWNMPVSARSRTTSNSSITGFPARPGLEQSRVVRSREHSRPSSPSESVRSRATEDEADVNYEGERNSASPHPKQPQRQRPASPLPGPSLSRVRTPSSLSKPNNSDIHTATQVQSRLRRNPSQSSLTSEGSSRPSSPAELAHRPRAGREDEEVNHERERNWGSRQQKWTHSPANNKRAASPNLASHSRVRTQSLESDSSAPATSALGRPPAALLRRQPGEPSSPAHRPAVSSPSPEAVERQKSETSVPSFLRSKPTNGHTYDKLSRMSSHPIRPDSPLAPGNINGSAEPNGTPPRPAPASHFGWQFPRSRPQLPDFEPNITSPEHSPPPVHQSMARNAGSMKQSHIPVRSPGRVPKIEIKLNGDAKKFTKGHKRATTEFAEANGAIPPRIHFQPESEPEQDSASEPEILGAKSPLGMPYMSSVLS
jgi:serine/arginine repetitive matrix protein 2